MNGVLQSRPIPMDITILDPADPRRGLEDLSWPSPYSDYHLLSRTLIDSLVSTIRALHLAEDHAAIIRAKAYDIITDLSFAARLALDTANARKAGSRLLYDPKVCPILAFLEAGGDPSYSRSQRIWHHPVDPRVRARLRKAAKRLRSQIWAKCTSGARIDIHNRNNLVNTMLGSDMRKAIDWPVTNIDWSNNEVVPATLSDSVALLGQAYTDVVDGFIEDARLRTTLGALGTHLISGHLAKSWIDFETFKNHLRHRPMGEALISGTPKHLGRLAGWLYRREGRSVIRCAHGGERVFFADYEWGLAEFPDCDIYYAHSEGERDTLTKRLNSKATALVEPDQTITIETLGSPHHKALLARCRTRPRARDTNTILYVAGGYLGEQLGDFPNRKPPDPLYLDWQIDLVCTIKDLGFRVLVKPHPAGIAHGRHFLAPYVDGTIGGLFDPACVRADALVFDFAGTAFFDALATDIPMVFADMGVRPYDMSVYKDLVSRCPVVPALHDEFGRFRIQHDALGSALASAIEMDPQPPGFHDRYFGTRAVAD